MAVPTKKSINTKLLASIVIIIIVVSLSAVAAQYMLTPAPQQNSELPDMNLALVGDSGQQKNLTKQDILSLESYTGKGGIHSHGNQISGVGTYTGVSVTTLLDLVGGIKSGETMTATASDGYTMTYSYDAVVNGEGFATYDTDGSEKAATQPLKLILTYSFESSALPSGEGPLRLGILGSEGLVTQGNQWEKMVVELKVNSAEPEVTPTAKPTASPTGQPTAAPTATPSPTATPTPPPSILAAEITIVGADNTTITIHETDLISYTQTSGLGGKFNSAKGTFNYGTYAGVSITTLLDLVGGINSSQAVSVTAADGYLMEYNYATVTGAGLATFDPATNATTAAIHPITMILAYHYNGTSTNLPTYSDGTYLSIAFVGSDGYSTLGNLWSKYVVKLQVINK